MSMFMSILFMNLTPGAGKSPVEPLKPNKIFKNFMSPPTNKYIEKSKSGLQESLRVS